MRVQGLHHPILFATQGLRVHFPAMMSGFASMNNINQQGQDQYEKK
jgi:hypothetical protein